MSTHTQGRIKAVEVDITTTLMSEDGKHNLLTAENGATPGVWDEADARRLAACWNAFVGVPTEDIEKLGGVKLFNGKAPVDTAPPVVITQLQKDLLDYIANYTELHGYAPSQQEMADHFKYKSVTGIAERLDSMKARGVVAVARGKSRSITVTPAGQRAVVGPRIQRKRIVMAKDGGQ